MSTDNIEVLDRVGRPTTALAVLGAGVVTFGLLQSLVVPVLGIIRSDLHATPTAGAWILTANLLSAAVATPVVGRFGDLAGRRPVLIATLVALALGSLLAAIAPTIGVLLAARVVQGLGGGMLPLAFGIVRDEFPATRMASAVGLLAAMVAVGAGAGTGVAGPLVALLGWRWLFWMPLVMTAATALMALLLIPGSSAVRSGRIGWPSAVLLAGWLVTLLTGLSEGPDIGWTAPPVLALLLGTIVLGAAWAIVELHSPSPLIDVRLLARRSLWTNNLVALLLGVAMFGVFAAVPRLAQTPPHVGYGFGASGTQSGLLLLPMPVAMFIASLAHGPAANRWGGKTLVLSGAAISCAGTLALAFGLASAWEVSASVGVLGVGIGLAFSAMSALVVSAAPAQHVGAATGMNSNLRTIGGSIGATLVTAVLAARSHNDDLPLASGYTDAFLVLAGALLVAVIAAALIESPDRIKIRTPLAR